MITRDEVITALSHIYDAEFKRPVVELQFVRDVMVKENQVALTFLLSQESEELQNQYRQDVTEGLRKAGFEGDVHIRFRALSEHDRKAAEQKVGQAQPNPTAQQAPDRRVESPLTKETTFIAIASGKGGVGKSTVTVNLAVALARAGKKVGLIDADIYGFSVPDMMGIESRPTMNGNRIIPVERFGVKVISMGFFVEDNAPIIWRGPMLGKMLRNFLQEVEWGELDFLLLDLPPGTGDVALDVHQMIPTSKEIIVTTPHATAAFVAARAGAMARATEHEILGIVENMSYYMESTGEKAHIFGKGGGAKLAEELHSELLAQIPLGAPDNHPAEQDYSPSVYKAESEQGKMYLEIANRIIDKLS